MVRHRKMFVCRKKVLLFEVETVLAVETANRPDRLGHYMKRAQVWSFATLVNRRCIHRNKIRFHFCSGSSRAPSPMEETLPRREDNFVREQTDDDDDKHDADNLVHGI